MLSSMVLHDKGDTRMVHYGDDLLWVFEALNELEADDVITEEEMLNLCMTLGD